MLEVKSEIDLSKIVDKMFTYADNRDEQANRARCLIVNPEMLRVLLRQLSELVLEEKLSVWSEVMQIFLTNSLNVCILANRDKQIMEFNHSIYNEIVDFMFSSLPARSSRAQEGHRILTCFCDLVSKYPVSCRNIKNIISKVSKNFHRGKFCCQILQTSIRILTEIFRNQVEPLKQPKSYFVMYGPNSGLRMVCSNQINWPLSKGFHFYINFQIEGQLHDEMVLLNIAVNNDTFELVIDQDNNLMIKVFSTNKYLKVRGLENKKWYLLKLAYSLRTGIIRNSYEAVINLEDSSHEFRDLPFSTPSIKDKIEQLIIAYNFYGKVNYTSISREQLCYFPKNGLNTYSQLQGFLAANKNKLKQIFLLYTPLTMSEFSSGQLVYDITSKNHAQLCENTIVYVSQLEIIEKNINYFGGLYTFIPFFHILRFYRYEEYPTALEDMLEMIYQMFMREYGRVEEEAINCQFFGILAQSLNRIDCRYITLKCTQILTKWKQLLDNKDLVSQFLINFLAKISIDRIKDTQVVQSIVKIISSFYEEDLLGTLQIYPLSSVLWYIVDNLEPDNWKNCCALHYWQLNYTHSSSQPNQQAMRSDQQFSQMNLIEIKDQYKVKGRQIKCLVKNIIEKICVVKKFEYMNSNCDIFWFLSHPYSICFKSLLMECLMVGIQSEVSYFSKQASLLPTMYRLLSESQLIDQIVPVFCVFKQIVLEKVRSADPLIHEIISQIGSHLQTLPVIKYESNIRLRSRSEELKLSRFEEPVEEKLDESKISTQFCEEENPLSLENKDSHLLENRVLPNFRDRESRINLQANQQKLMKLKRQISRVKIGHDRQLFDTLVETCCVQDNQTGYYILHSDEFVNIIAPYYKICCGVNKKNLIQILINTAMRLIASHNPCDQSSDNIYRLMLSELILMEVKPNSEFSDHTNDLINGLFSIIDSMVKQMKNNWAALHSYLIRLTQLLKFARSSITIDGSRTYQLILTASHICERNLILHVISNVPQTRQSISSIICMIYSTVFSNGHNDKQTQTNVFQFFKTLEQHLFVGHLKILTGFNHRKILHQIFIDEALILSMMNILNFADQISTDITQQKSQIKAYLSKQGNNKLQQCLLRHRDLHLSRVEIRDSSKSIGLSINYSNKASKTNQQTDLQFLYISEMVAQLICLCVDSSLNCRRYQAFSQSLSQLIMFAKSFALSVTRNDLNSKMSSLRNKKLSIKLMKDLIHFLYQLRNGITNDTLPSKQLMNNQSGFQKSHHQIQQVLLEGIYQIVRFCTQIVSVLCNNLGNPLSISDAMTLLETTHQFQCFNFFTFQLFDRKVLTLDQIQIFSTLNKKSANQILQSQAMKNSFSGQSDLFGVKCMKKVVEIHLNNSEKVSKELTDKFRDQVLFDRFGSVYNEKIFEQQRLKHARELNLEYRQLRRVWRKIWKRLRLYHYYWAVQMNQRDQNNDIKNDHQNNNFIEQWSKNKQMPYRHKFGKYMDLEGIRPILQVEPREPWHIRKAQLDEQVEYRSKNFMINLYKSQTKNPHEPSSLIARILRKYSMGTAINTFTVLWIKNNSKRKGQLKVDQNRQKLIFTYDSTYQKDSHVDFTPFLLAEHRPMVKTWPLVWIVSILKRRYLMKEQSLLVQFEDNTSLVFHFLDGNVDMFLTMIEECQMEKQDKIQFLKNNHITFYLSSFAARNSREEIERVCEEWCQGKLTNLHYLMLINKYSGRSCLDPVHYPVVPWVVSNYQSSDVVFRDLSKTLGDLGSLARRQVVAQKFDEMNPFHNVPGYQYGTHYSSPAVVFNFLVRISPYTEAAKTLQGGRFDLSDRLFSSLEVCWHSVTTQVSDVRELLPEFFYFPEFLTNIEHHDLGETQTKDRIHNVKLPPWGNNPWDFIVSHRRALESPEVTLAIHNWIDLIFGYKQKGKLAQESLNLYYYLTYENAIDINSIQDEVEKASIEAQIIHFGQTPSQIFSKPHPQHRAVPVKSKGSQGHKIEFVGIIDEFATPILIMGWQGSPENGNMLIYKDSELLIVSQSSKLKVKQKTSLLRKTSRENLYHMEDINASSKKIRIFKENRFIAIASYVNGDLVVFCRSSGSKVSHQKGYVKSVLYVNKAENLILCGSKNGLLEVYEIVYTEKDKLTLIKIIEEYFMFPIEEISQGAGFYCLSAGNLIIISKITRSMSYVHDKKKMQGQKIIRSFDSIRKVHGAFICTNPLYCLVYWNALQVYVYSINGQFLKTRDIQNLVDPILIIDQQKRENLLVLQPSGLTLLKIPELETLLCVPVPKKEYTSMKLINCKVYLVSSGGQIFYVLNQKQL